MNESNVLENGFMEYIKEESFTYDSVLYVINWIKQYQAEWPDNSRSYLFEGILWEMVQLEDEAFSLYERFLASSQLQKNNVLMQFKQSIKEGEGLIDFPITISIETVETQISIAFSDRNIEELMPLLNSYLSENPTHAGFLLFKAIVLFEQQKWDECIEYCNRIIELAPLTYEAYYYRTAAESWIDFDYDRVMAGLNQVIRIFPYHINTLIDKASLVEDDDPELAEELYRQVLMLSPNISWVIEKVMAEQ
jgi:tetratricopeptide (TPR) repeat protein